ncbi:MAG: hypothetical protein R3284_09945, partial [Rubricoccaceae bacterium]|nr:hypothetical protein [Rubricoccaceae bacterium]
MTLSTIPDKVQRAYRSARRFYRRPYVTGLAIGEPRRSGTYQIDQLAVCIHVKEKAPVANLTRNQVFPREIDGVPIDVCERTFTAHGLTPAERLARQILPADPAAPGVQVGVSGGIEGSFGMVVYDLSDGGACLL